MRGESSLTQSREADGSIQSIRLVYPQEAVKRWPYFLYRLSAVLDRTDLEYSPDDILTALQLGRMHLWQAVRHDAIAVTQVQEFPRYRQFLVYAVAGKDAREWIAQGSHDLDRVAQSTGCDVIAFYGRKGWEKYAQPLGYTQQLVVMRKRL